MPKPITTTTMPIGCENTALTPSKLPSATLPVLSVDVWGKVFEFVPAHDLLKDVAKASPHFASILRDDCFWKAYATILTNNDRNWDHYQRYGIVNNCLQLQQLCVFATAMRQTWRCCGDETSTDRVCRCAISQSLLPTTDQAAPARYGLGKHGTWTCLASTTHHTPQEAIEYTLSPAARNPWTDRPLPPGWWSSQPTQTGDTQENLLYITSSPCTYLSNLSINPLVDFFQGRIQVYGWHQTQITAYLVPPFHREQHCSIRGLTVTAPSRWLNDRQMMEAFLQNQVPVYQSPLQPTKKIAGPLRLDSDAWEHHEFPRGIVANAIVITLYGKQAQERLGYYACVEQVKVEGIPLCERRDELLGSLNSRYFRDWQWDEGASASDASTSSNDESENDSSDDEQGSSSTDHEDSMDEESGSEENDDDDDSFRVQEDVVAMAGFVVDTNEH